MEIRAGGSGTLAACWGGGCGGAAIAEALNPALARPLAASRPFNGPNPYGGRETASRPGSGRLRPESAKTEAAGSPLTNERDPPKGRGTPQPGALRAAALWRDSIPVPLDTRHPAQRWAARRRLWPPGEPWPAAVRWLPSCTTIPTVSGGVEAGGGAIGTGGGSLVAAFAPLADWTEAHPPAHPSGVQLVHVGADGRPRKDGGGLAKRSHGAMTGAVCVTGAPLWRGEALHVAEGIADALAIAARASGSAIATGGTSGLASLADALAATGAPVTLWPDGDPAGRLAAEALARRLRARAVAVAVARIPDGEDPASLAAPFSAAVTGDP